MTITKCDTPMGIQELTHPAEATVNGIETYFENGVLYGIGREDAFYEINYDRTFSAGYRKPFRSKARGEKLSLVRCPMSYRDGTYVTEVVITVNEVNGNE